MELWLHDHSTNTRSTIEADGQVMTIGRDDDCQIVLKSPFVARKHARISRKGNQFVLEAISRSGTRVANREVQPGEPVKIDFGDEIQIGQYSLAMLGTQRDGRGADSAEQLQAKLMDFEQRTHAELLERMNLRATGHLNKQDERFVEQILVHLEDILTRRVNELDKAVISHT
ncbi:MAG: FHA domain-containing protein, partial [Planctomycetes bacterium]|nr:FHA domain-containing protein [Planctomycetota bacterium]